MSSRFLSEHVTRYMNSSDKLGAHVVCWIFAKLEAQKNIRHISTHLVIELGSERAKGNRLKDG